MRFADGNAHIRPPGFFSFAILLLPIVIPLRMRPMPVPRRADDGIQFRIAWLPAEFLLNALRRRDKFGRVAGAAWAFLDGDGFAGRFFHGADHFADAVASAD